MSGIDITTSSNFPLCLPAVDGELEEPSPSPVLAEEYWASEHHRFKYSDSIDALLQNDPLSYHSMGIAVPGTFVEER